MLLSRLPTGSRFHLAVIFVTESNPGGGWWARSGHSALQVEEKEHLKWIGNQLRQLAAEAATVRYFGVACGSNLRGQGIVNNICEGLFS